MINNNETRLASGIPIFPSDIFSVSKSSIKQYFPMFFLVVLDWFRLFQFPSVFLQISFFFLAGSSRHISSFNRAEISTPLRFKECLRKAIKPSSSSSLNSLTVPRPQQKSNQLHFKQKKTERNLSSENSS